MNIIAFLIVGLIGGWIANILGEGRGLGIAGDVIIGIIGAFIGGFFADSLGIFTTGDFWSALGTSVLGAVVLLFFVELIARGVKAQRPADRF